MMFSSVLEFIWSSYLSASLYFFALTFLNLLVCA